MAPATQALQPASGSSRRRSRTAQMTTRPMTAGSDVGAGPLHGRRRPEARPGQQPPRAAEGRPPPPRSRCSRVGWRVVAIEDDREDGTDDEEHDERVEHRDPGLHDGQQVGGEQPGRGGRSDRERRPGTESAQQPPPEQVDERHAQRPGGRDRHAPAERVVAEGRDPGADEPLPERWMRAADEATDVAHRLAAGHVPAGVARVEDLVEDQLDRASERDEAQRGGSQRDGDQRERVTPRPCESRAVGWGVDDGLPDGCRTSVFVC